METCNQEDRQILQLEFLYFKNLDFYNKMIVDLFYQWRKETTNSDDNGV